MNIETVSMDTRIARIHYLDYRKKVRQHRDARLKELSEQSSELGRQLGQVRIKKNQLEREDEELSKVYLALSKGNQVLNLPRSLKKAGFNKKYEPKLAIAEADWPHVFCTAHGTSLRFCEVSNPWRRDHGFVSTRLDVPAEAWNNTWRRQNNLGEYPLKALVPAIPPQFRPNNLRGYYLLWEPVWEPSAPADPILLKRISDSNYVVVAQWDLTPVEQLVLEGRSPF